MKQPSASAAVTRLIFAATCLAAALFGLYYVRTFDTFFQLAAGRFIVEHGAIPRADPFSFTFRGATWHDHSWGYQVLIAKLHELGGFAMLSLLQAALAGATCALALDRLRNAPELLPWGALACALPYVTFREMLEARPHMFAFACLAATLRVVLSAYERERPARLAWLVPIYAAWASAHGSHLLAWIVVGLGALVSGLWRRPRLALGFGCALASLVVASLWLAPDALRLGSEHVASSFLEANVSEWAPVTPAILLGSAQGISFVVLLLSAFAGALLEWRSNEARLAGPLHYALLLLLSTIAFTSVRMLGLFVFGAAPLWAPFAARALRPLQHERRAPLVFALGLFALALGAFASEGAFRFGAGLMQERLPTAALAYMRKVDRPKRLYNAYNFGGYLIWERFPAAGVFVDGRAITVYPAEFLAAFERAYADPRMFEALAARFAIDGVLLPSDSAKTQKLLAYLRANPRYRATYSDAVASVFELR